VVILELRGLHEALEQKVGSIQHEFTAITDQLAVLRRKWSEVEEPERPAIVKEQDSLNEKQVVLADQVNLWRDRIRAIESPRSEKALQDLLEELLQSGEKEIVTAVEEVKRLMVMDPEEKAALFNKASATTSRTPVGRLLERARTSYDLRNGGPTVRQQVAVEFANRTNISQDDSVLAELEASIENSDPVVSEVVVRTLIQILRFRAVRSAELQIVQQAVQKMTKIKSPLVIPALIEVVQKSRTGYIITEKGMEEGSNSASRMMALIALVDWRTHESQDAIRHCTLDREAQIANAASRALEAFPGEWAGKTE
jgi:hypothetical protein